MSKKTLSSIVKAAGLAAILAGTTGCGIAGNTIGMHQKSPYTAGFIGGMGSLADSQYAARGKGSNSVEYRILTYKDGGKYKGFAINTGGSFYAPHGVGTYWYPEGSVYEGEFFRGYRGGRGKLMFKDGRVLEGEWENDEFKGNSISSKE